MTSRGFSAAAIASIVFRCQEADLADRLTLGSGVEIECARFSPLHVLLEYTREDLLPNFPENADFRSSISGEVTQLTWSGRVTLPLIITASGRQP